MKRMFLFLTILTIGIVSVSAEKGTKNEKMDTKESLYKEAVEALYNQRFVVTFHAEEWKSRNRLDLDSKRNFLIVDGQKGFFQKSIKSDFSSKNMTGGYGLTPLKMMESDVVKTRKVYNKKGDILYTVLLEGESNIFGGKNIKEAKITLKQGSHDVVVNVKYKGGDSTVYIGSLHPIDAVNLERGILYR